MMKCSGSPLKSSLAFVPFRASNQVSAQRSGDLRRRRHGSQSNRSLYQETGTARRRLVARAGDDNDELPWERKERLQNLADKDGKELPFAVYLVASSIVAIAAVGSIFEIINKNSIFGVVPPSSPLWLPILGTFGVTGLPSAGFLFFKAISTANADADRQNKADGY